MPIHYGVTDGIHKLIRFEDKHIDAWEYFDRSRDPMEMKSEYANPEYSTKVKELTSEIELWQRKLGIR